MVEVETATNEVVKKTWSRKKKWLACLWALGVAVPVSLGFWNIFGPRPRLVISPGTTYFTEPTTEAGYVNYPQALLNEYGHSEASANDEVMRRLTRDRQVLLQHALRPASIVPDEFGRLNLPIEFMTYVDEIKLLRFNVPFTKEEDPLTAKMVEQNEDFYEDLRIVAQTRFSLSLSTWQKTDPVGATFKFDREDTGYSPQIPISVMLKLGEHRYQEAWRDIELMQSLAQRRRQTPATFYPKNSGDCFAMFQVCRCASVAILHQDMVCPETEAWLERLPTAASPDDLRFRFSQIRVGLLAEVQDLHRQQPPLRLDRNLVNDLRVRWDDSKYDWNSAMRGVNLMFDRLDSEVSSLETLVEQKEALTRIEYSTKNLIIGGRNAARQSIKDCRYVIEQSHALTCRLRLTHLAAALVSWKQSTGQFPDRLQALIEDQGSGKLNKNLTIDPFFGDPFIYQRAGDGFVLYSRGENGADDTINGGAEFFATSEAGAYYDREGGETDDIVLRWPIKPSEEQRYFW